MRKIINGKMYDTDTAKLCGELTDEMIAKVETIELELGDDFWGIEYLYLKKTGEFFLYNIYGVGDDKESIGEHINPITVQKAKSWMEEWQSIEDYEALFGKVEE